MDIMSMSSGTKIYNNRNGVIYVLGDFVNDVARELISEGYGLIDYINKNTQGDYDTTEI